MLPVIGDKLAPRVAERAPLVGAAIKDRFDVIALGECFEEPEQTAVAAAWPEAEMVSGPLRRGPRAGSGLATLTDPRSVSVDHVAQHRYRAGGDLRDSDTFATKGALLTRIRLGGPGGPRLDVVSTHLLAGGDLLPLPGADDSVRHHAARMGQTDELASFIESERQPGVPVLLVGDFNVQRHNRSLADPAGDYDDLAVRLERIGLADLWAEHGVGPGHSCTFTDSAQLPPDPDEPDQVADDPDADPATEPGERIDYLWLAPAADGSVTVEVDRPRRWAFSGRGVRGGAGGSLSDHLALSVTLHLS